jgi:hypothetical protein
VVNIVVQYYELTPGADEYGTSDARNVAQMSIVIDDDTALQGSNDYEPVSYTDVVSYNRTQQEH